MAVAAWFTYSIWTNLSKLAYYTGASQFIGWKPIFYFIYLCVFLVIQIKWAEMKSKVVMLPFYKIHLEASWNFSSLNTSISFSWHTPALSPVQIFMQYCKSVISRHSYYFVLLSSEHKISSLSWTMSYVHVETIHCDCAVIS